MQHSLAERPSPGDRVLTAVDSVTQIADSRNYSLPNWADLPPDSSIRAASELLRWHDPQSLALALAFVMRGSVAGFSERQADYSASLYDFLLLPAGPAASNLAALESSGHVRRRAVEALKRQLADTATVHAALSAICLLEARGDAVRRFLGVSTSPASLHFLASDEQIALIGILDALNRVSNRDLRISLREFLEPTSFLVPYVRNRFPSLW